MPEILQIVDGLLDIEHLKALNAEVRVWIREAEESVLKNDRGTMLLLGNLSVDGNIGQITSVCCIDRRW